MKNTITAYELRTKGISAANKLGKKGFETFVTVRGETKYVILPAKTYYNLKEHELNAALMESEQDLKNGKFHKDSIEDHIKRITNA